MRIEVRLFGGLADRAGARRIDVELPGTATVGDLRDAVAAQHAGLAGLLGRTSVAMDLRTADDDEPVSPDAEVALLPPVAGGAQAPLGAPVGALRVRDDGRRALTGLASPPLAPEATLRSIAAPGVGGTVSFLGTVRDHAPDLDAAVVGLDYEAYPRMAERVLGEIAEELLEARPALRGIALVHAVGELAIGDHTVLIGCASAHRDEAFDACRAALEEVTGRVPVFKRERTADGAHRWVGLETDPRTGPHRG